MKHSPPDVYSDLPILNFIGSVSFAAIESRRIEFLTKTSKSYTVGRVQVAPKNWKFRCRDVSVLDGPHCMLGSVFLAGRKYGGNENTLQAFIFLANSTVWILPDFSVSSKCYLQQLTIIDPERIKHNFEKRWEWPANGYQALDPPTC